MDEIVILSGKGGTGKTSIAAALAMIVGNEAIIADCDVDAANMHLVLEPDFAITHDFYSGLLAVVDSEACTVCGECLRVCRFEAVELNSKFAQINPMGCEGCGYCEKVCPVNAISMINRKAGHVFLSQIKSGTIMVHARLDPGPENSGKLVARVKNEAKSLAHNYNKPFIITDGSPGIGCPVVSSLSGASIVLLITEPSLSALHDLKRLLKMLLNFKIPAACIINKSDLDEKSVTQIKEFLSEHSIPHVADIPFNASFSQAMVQGKTIVEFDPELKKVIVDIWGKVKQIVLTNKKNR